jgi:predicted pyridoxine 5'-phosphate oxidase superfamily flavin-nucleotide-binding protein
MLTIHTRLPADDPATLGWQPGRQSACWGSNCTPRRRNRINGQIRQAAQGQLQVAVEQSFGNCPQYIQLRDYTRVTEPALGRIDATTLDASTVSMIQAADTFFVASYVEHEDGQRSVDVTVAVGQGSSRSKATRLTIPDYAGNLHFNTLGNLLVNPRAGLLFIDFSNGNVLQLYGRAEVLLDSPAIQAFEGRAAVDAGGRAGGVASGSRCPALGFQGIRADQPDDRHLGRGRCAPGSGDNSANGWPGGAAGGAGKPRHPLVLSRTTGRLPCGLCPWPASACAGDA